MSLFIQRAVTSIVSSVLFAGLFIKGSVGKLFDLYGLRQIKESFQAITFKTLSSQLVSLFLMISILTTSTPAAQPTLLMVTMNEFGQDARYSYLSGFDSAALRTTVSGFLTDLAATLNPVLGAVTGRGIFRKGKNNQEPRPLPERLVILPTNETNTLTVLQGEKINFTAVGVGKDEQPTSGVDFKWTVSDQSGKRPPRPLNNGLFEARSAGAFTVTVEAAGKQAQVAVLVSPNGGAAVQQLLQKPEEARTDGERALIAKVREKGTITTRRASTQGEHNREEEERLTQQVKKQLDDIRAKQAERLRQLQTAAPAPPSNSNQPSDPNQPRPQGPSAETAEPIPAPDEALAAEAEKAEKAESARRTAEMTALSALLRRPFDEDGWDGTNYWEATRPYNQIGSTPGMAPAAGASNGNAQLAAPVIALPGRGLDVNLALYYNSRLWSRTGSTMSYDADKGNPAPGWNLGFGKMINLIGGGGCMVVDADGTRHSHDGSNNSYTYNGYYSNYYNGYTKDGSFIDYGCAYYSNPYGSGFSGVAKLPNGTVINYNSATGNRDQAYPTQITDAQGNYITITYVGNQGPNIQTITDTLGRVITFNYDGSGRLVSITGPGQGYGTQVLVRLHYSQLSLSYAFAPGLATDTPTNAPYVLDAIYYPANNTGYWFGDGGGSPSYSSYGMIAKVMQMRGMGWSGANNNDQGSVSMGAMTHQQVYNFPLGPDYSLLDAPDYTTTTESWYAMEGTPAAVTTYAVSGTSTEDVITVTAPNGTKSRQTSYINPGAWNDGVYFKNETLDASNNVLGKTQTYMQAGDYGSFRPTRVETTDERNQTTAVEYTYTGYYNQAATVKEFNYANQLYRETRTTYENSAAYIYRHIFNLVKTQEIFDAGNNRLARTDYEYDNNAVVSGTSNHNLMATPGVIMHQATSDPYTSQTQNGNCINGQFNHSQCTYEGEYVWVWQAGGYEDVCHYECYQYQQVSVYDPNSIFRGNLTKTVTYTDAAGLTGALAYDYTYDVTGNRRTATTNCCQQMQFTYAGWFYYAYPTSMTKGSPSDPNLQITQSGWFDYNTGQQTSSTDFNGRSTYYYYDAARRPTYIAYPTGGKRTLGYDDAALYLFDFTKEANDTIASGTLTYFNGRGQSRGQSTLLSAGVGGSAEWRFDAMGRKTQVSMPYFGSTPTLWTTYQYDALSRPVQVTAPDGSVSQTFYNETTRPSSASTAPGQTVRSRDAWGRERWARTDDFGRTAEVVEPDPNGSGAVAGAGNLQTGYGYDALDRLVQVSQGTQTRGFRYDSLGRLIRQKLAEQSATISDAGAYVGAGNGLWSEAFVYDARSNLVQRTDARGVKSNYNYLLNGGADPLNRLQSVTYDLTGADTSKPIQYVAPVTMEYMTTGDKTRVSKVLSAGGWTEENAYDIEGRVSEYKVWTVLRPSEPMTTSYLYDTVSRLTEVRYPAQYGMTGAPRKIVTPSYDSVSRLTELRVDNQIQLSEIAYNPLSQVTQLKTGAATGNADIEQYSYDGQTGLLTNQKVIKPNSNTTLLDLTYEYQRGNSNGTQSGKTGQLTRITDNLDHNKNRLYEFDALGRLRTAKGGLGAGVGNPVANWQQNYAYDRYANRTTVTASGTTANSAAVPVDGLANLSYDHNSNRINTSGYEYDLSGNLTRGQKPDGSWQRYEYDAAGRLSVVRNDATNALEYGNGYTSSRQRISSFSDAVPNLVTYYAWGGSAVLAEYATSLVNNQTTSTWQKAYIYAGSRLLTTYTKNGSGGETQEYHHPDRLGTKLVTNDAANTSFEQSTLPFGTSLAAETTGTTNQRFTSYDRSTVAQLDYAVNRSYSSGQSRFTSVDPIGMGATNILNPQSMNLYAYVENNPIDFIDPSGLESWTVVVPISFDDEVDSAEAAINRLIEIYQKAFGSRGGGGHEGGGGGGALLEPPQKNKLETSVDECAKAFFNVTLTSFKATSKGSDGYANFQTINGTTINRYGGDMGKDGIVEKVTGFGVLNDVNSFSIKDLTSKETAKKGDETVGQAQGMNVPGIIQKNHTGKGTGKTVPGATNINYTARDNNVETSQGVSGYTWTQIHELGNSLSHLTGGNYSNKKKKDKDAGQVFEDCVSGVLKTL